MTIYPGSMQVEPMKYANKPSDAQVLSSWESGDWVAQQKIDGAWYQLEKTDDGAVYLFGRTLSKKTGEYTEKIDNVPHIKKWAEFYLPNGTTLIGEIYVPGGKSNDVTKIMGCTAANAYKRQFETDEYGGPIHYYVFDIIRYMGQDLCDIGFEKRYKQGLVRELELNLLAFEDIDSGYVHLAPLYEDNFEQHLQEIFANGGEGMVFKKKDCPYRAGKRTTASQMYKYKEHMDSVDLVCMELLDPVKEYTGKELDTWPYWIVEFCQFGSNQWVDHCHTTLAEKNEWHDKDRFRVIPVTKPYYYGWKNTIRLGAYKNGELIEIGRVASGLNDELRFDLAANPDKYLGKVVEIECMSTTKDNAIRHPVFVRFRDDKDPNDCLYDEIFN